MSSAASASDGAREWKLDVSDATLVQALAYVFPSVLGGVLLLVGALVGALVGSAVLTGDFGRLGGLLAIAVFGIVAHRYLLPLGMITSNQFRGRYSRRGLMVGSVLGALVLLGSAHLHPAAPFAVFVLSWIPLVLTAAFPTTGYANPETNTLVVDGNEVPIEAVRRVRAVPIGAVTVCWVSYARGVPSASRLLVIPAAQFDPISQIVERASGATDGEPSAIGRPERLVAALFGLGMMALGPLLWFALPPGDGAAIALYASAIFGLFGLLLLWYAHSA